jgi:hypothetical protein
MRRAGIARWGRAVVLGAVLRGPAWLGGQPTPSTGEVRLTVTTAAGDPVAAAEVVLSAGKGAALRERADSSGRVRFVGVRPGLWPLSVRRLGVAPVDVRVRVEAGTNSYTVQVSETAASLTGVRVVGDRAYSARLDDFERRRLSGAASAVVSRDQIDRLRPVLLSRMLRGMAGLRLGDSVGYTVAISSRGAKPSRTNSMGFGLVDCVMRVVVDGVLQPPLTNLDAIVPSDVHGIEIFNGPSRLPLELAGLRTDNWCGVIAVWTRDR